MRGENFDREDSFSVKRENQPPLLCGIKEECAGKEGKYTKT
jgi:hypothetical protein